MSRSKSSRPGFRSRGERGYVLLTLLLFASLLVVTAAAVAPRIALQIRRDREEELIHRGMQYRRAIHSFAKHTGRFPLTLDELENTNGTRYLRKRYKDPMTGGEFRLLHMDDIAATGARLNTPDPPPGEDAGVGSPDPSASSTVAANSADASVDPNAAPKASAGSAPQSALQNGAQSSGAQPGGGVIFGVVSRSAKKTIREFDHKNRYNDWLFFYSAIYDGSVEVPGPTPMHPIFATQNTPPSSSNQPAPQSASTQQ